MIYLLWLRFINNQIYVYNLSKIKFWINTDNNLYNNLDDIYNYINGRNRILL